MADKVRMKLLRPLDEEHPGKQVGDEIELDVSEVKRYVNSGAAAPATIPEAKRARVDPSTAVTAKD